MLTDFSSIKLLSAISIETVFGIFVVLVFTIFWLHVFFILFHLMRFGVGLGAKRFSLITLIGSTLLSSITLIIYILK